MLKRIISLGIVLVSVLAIVAPTFAQANPPKGDFEIFTWWAGDEGPAKDALIAQYKTLYPDVNVIDAAVTGGSGVNARAVLKTRMLGGDAPDTFQVHAGQELIGTWVVSDRMVDLTSLFQSEGWMDKFPQSLIDLLSYNGGIWSVPVNIHRSNVMWFMPAKLKEWGVEAPKTWDDFLTICPTLKAKGVTPLEVGQDWTQEHLWENVAVAALGADGWKALWAGEKKWTDPDVMAVWDEFGKVLDCTNINEDAATLSWQQATDALVAGKAAFNIMGDWAEGYMATTLKLQPNTDFGWAPAPGTSGIFIMLSDSFGLPKGAKNPDATTAWLKLCGSQEGQDIFNPLKGSIAARLDSDLTKYNVYSQSAAADWKSNVIVGSLTHGAVAPESFSSQFPTILGVYVGTRNSQLAANASQATAVMAGINK